MSARHSRMKTFHKTMRTGSSGKAIVVTLERENIHLKAGKQLVQSLCITGFYFEKLFKKIALLGLKAENNQYQSRWKQREK